VAELRRPGCKCFVKGSVPETEDAGIKSPVCEHFGSAPIFMIVETESGECRAVTNGNMHHGHGMCAPLQSLQGEELDGMVVGGIGMGALYKLQAAGIQVYMADHETVEETIAAYTAGALHPVTPATACAHHGHGPSGDRQRD
jgi:predicted Fe-Mo cluster-binding NifX family protein